jgi:hypothetical protein
MRGVSMARMLPRVRRGGPQVIGAVPLTWSGFMHLVLHAAVPAIVAVLFFRPRWQRAWLIMFASMLVDLDHLLADPIYDPDRCSIGFHPLHSYPAIAVYVVLLVPRVTRLPALGLVLHMIVDAVDCIRQALGSS